MENRTSAWWQPLPILGTTPSFVHSSVFIEPDSCDATPPSHFHLGIAKTPVNRKDSALSPIHKTYYNSSFSKEPIWCSHRAHRKEPIT